MRPGSRSGTDGHATPRPSDDPRRDGWALLRDVAMLALVVRVVLQLVIVVVNGTAPDVALRSWSRWDAPHFLRIADVGYRPLGEDALFIVFLPGYPALVAVVSVVVRSTLVAGLLVSYVASVGAGYLLYRIVRLDAPDDAAWRAVVLLFLFPTAYFLAAPYSEAVFLAAVLAAVYAARTGRWPWAGAAAAVATATRVPGVVVLAFLAVEAFRGRRERAQVIRRLAWSSVGVVGGIVYLTVNAAVHGHPLHFLSVQRSHWDNAAAPFWEPLVVAADRIAAGGLGADRLTIYWGRIGATALVVGVLAFGARRLRVSDHVFAWGTLILLLSSTWLLSLPRYILGIFPLFIVAAKALDVRPAFWTVAALSAGLQIALFARYAAGHWTF